MKKTMYLLIRCLTCKKTLGYLVPEIESLRETKAFPPKTHGIKPYCCKTIVISIVNAFEKFSIKRDTSFYEVKNLKKIILFLQILESSCHLPNTLKYY